MTHPDPAQEFDPSPSSPMSGTPVSPTGNEADHGRAASCVAPYCADPTTHVLSPDELDLALELIKASRAPERWLPLPANPETSIPVLGFERHGCILVQRADSAVNGAWVIGDVHGDPVGLACSLAFVRGHGQPGDIVVLLGDLIDDLPESIPVIAMLAREKHAPLGGRILCLRGNHDIALTIGPDGSFSSSVDPSELCDYLRSSAARPDRAREEELARSFVDHFMGAPAAIFLKDGTLLAHGGVPHVDLQRAMTTREELGAAPPGSDFVWARMVNVRRRMAQPQSLTRSREIGSEDFREFRELTHVMFGSSTCAGVERMVRGHDHVEERYEILGGHWERRVVTINNMSRRLGRELAPPGPTAPCLVEWRAGEPLSPIRLLIDRTWQDRVSHHESLEIHT